MRLCFFLASLLLGLAISAFPTSAPQTINPAAALSLEAEHHNTISKRAVGPFCYPRLGSPSYASCQSAWGYIPSTIEPTLFGPVELGAQVNLPRFFWPRAGRDNNPTSEPNSQCGFIVFHWPRTRQLSSSPWITLRLAARQLMLQCALGKSEGGYFYGFGTAPPQTLDASPRPGAPPPQAIDGNLAIAMVRLPKPTEGDHPSNQAGGWARFLSSCAWDVAGNPYSDVSLGACPEYGGADDLVGLGEGDLGNGGHGNGGGRQATVSCKSGGGEGYCRSDADCKGCTCRVVELANSILQFGMGSVLVGGCSS